MVIRRQDRVSDVLRHDESLIDVFVALSPAFERLRNRALRQVMARLVTVEQAARMGGVDPGELVARLNERASGHNGAAGSGTASDSGKETGPAGSHDEVARAAPPPGGDPGGPSAARALPPSLAAFPDDRIIDVDARDDLRNGREPFSRIMAARRRVPDGGVLRVRAIFEPVPLYAALAKQGFAHHTEQIGPDDWRVWFYPHEPRDRDTGDAAPTATQRAADAPTDADRNAGDGAGADAGGDAGVGKDVVVLDVRGLEPPEPMVRTLAALETMRADATLVQVNVRVPEFLLPRLEERGFVYEIHVQQPDLVRVLIRRAPTH